MISCILVFGLCISRAVSYLGQSVVGYISWSIADISDGDMIIIILFLNSNVLLINY